MIVFKMVAGAMRNGKARVACAVAGIAVATGAYVFTASLAHTNSAQAPAAAEKASSPWAAWKTEGVKIFRRRGKAGSEIPLVSRDHLPPLSTPADLSLKAFSLCVDHRPGGRVLQGPPVRVLLAGAPAENPYASVKLEKGRWVEHDVAEAEVVCVVSAMRRSLREDVPPVGATVKFIGEKSTMTARVVGYLSAARLPRSFPTVFANGKALSDLSAETPGRVSFYKTVPDVEGVLTPRSASVIESFKGDSQRHMDYAKPLMIIAAFLTALSLLVNSLLLSVEATKDELAKLRAVGMTRPSLVLFTALEALVTALAGWAAGVSAAAASLYLYVSSSPDFPSGVSFDFIRIALSFFALLPVVFLSVLFSLSGLLRVRGIPSPPRRARSTRRGMIIAYACGFAAFTAVEVWGASLMRAFVPSKEWPDAIVSLLPGGVSSFEVEKLRDIEGVKRISELVPRQLPLSARHVPPSDATASDNALFLAAEYLPAFDFVEGDFESSSEALKNGRFVVIDLMLSRSLSLHKGDSLSVVRRGRKGGEELDFEIAGVVDVNWHMVTSRGLVRGLKGAHPMTRGPVFCSLDTMGEIDPSTFTVDSSFSAPMTHLWVEYEADFPKKRGVFEAGREVEKEIVRKLGNPPQATVRLHARDEIADGTLARGSNVIGQVARVPFVFLAVLAIGFIAMLVAESQVRSKEFALLRAVGATTFQIALRLVSSALKTAFFGMAWGFGAGALAGWYFALVTAARWPGMPHYFVLPWSLMAEGAAGGVLFALAFAVPSSLYLVRSFRRK